MKKNKIDKSSKKINNSYVKSVYEYTEKEKDRLFHHIDAVMKGMNFVFFDGFVVCSPEYFDSEARESTQDLEKLLSINSKKISDIRRIINE